MIHKADRDEIKTTLAANAAKTTITLGDMSNVTELEFSGTLYHVSTTPINPILAPNDELVVTSSSDGSRIASGTWAAGTAARAASETITPGYTGVAIGVSLNVGGTPVRSAFFGKALIHDGVVTCVIQGTSRSTATPGGMHAWRTYFSEFLISDLSSGSLTSFVLRDNTGTALVGADSWIRIKKIRDE